MILTDGFSTVITFGLDGAIKLIERASGDITPPGWDGGGPNDTSSMRNTALRTRQPKKLVTMTDMTYTAFYDPEVYDSILAIINRIGTVFVTFPDGSILEFQGWLDKFMPNGVKEGEPPTAQVTVCPSNQTAAFVESFPIFTPGP